MRLSALGIERCAKLKVRTGVVVGLNPNGTSFRVLMDGRKLPRTLHESYILSRRKRSNQLSLHSSVIVASAVMS